MQPDNRHAKVKQLFVEALQREPGERSRFLAEACGDDLSVLRETVELLELDFFSEQWFGCLEQEIKMDFFPALQDLEADQPDLKPSPGQTSSTPPLRLVDLIGRRLDEKYQIESLLGAGGMGAVFLATHLHTKRPVAIKVINPEFSDHPEFLERFRREAEAAGRLRHPNVVNTTDFGFVTIDEQRLAYLVMEFLDGQTLKALLREEVRLPLDLVLDIAEQVALAIGNAHAQGIIHRDLKPDNIWLEPNGRGGYNVKVLDFGIAKLLDGSLPAWKAPLASTPPPLSPPPPAAPPSETTTQLQNSPQTGDNQKEATFASGLTRAGSIMGTPQYMSPEQCTGGPVDGRSDLYSLAVIVYEMLAGVPPFQGDMYQLLFKQVEVAPPSLKDHCPALAPEICQAVDQALAKSPEDRQPSPGAFVTHLQTLAGGVRLLTAEAQALTQEHKGEIRKLSVQVQAPFLVAASLLIGLLHHGPEIEIPWSPLVQFGLWSLPALFLAGARQMSQAALSLAIRHIQMHPKQALNHHQIRRHVWHWWPKLVSAFLKVVTQKGFGFRRKNNLWERWLLGGVTQDGESGTQFSMEPEAADQFLPLKKLTNQLFWQSAQSILIGLLLGIATMVEVREGLSRFPAVPQAMAWASGLLGSFSVLLLLSYWLAIPLDGAGAVLGFKASRVRGKSKVQGAILSRLDWPGFGRKTPFRLRPFPLRATSAFLLFLLLTTQFLLVPTWGSLPQPRRTSWSIVPKEENSWTEYRVGLRKLGKTYEETREFPPGLVLYGHWGQSSLTAAEIAFLDTNQEALHHLREGVKRPKAQFSDQPYSFKSETLMFLSVRNLADLALAEARRLFEAGKPEDAISLALAAYHFATDMAEPSAPYYSHAVSMSLRGYVHTFFFGLLSQKELAPELLEKIARTIEEETRRMANPETVLQQDLGYTEEWLHDTLIKSNAFPVQSENLPTAFARLASPYCPGLRTQIYREAIRLHRESFEFVRPEISAYDFHGLLTKYGQLFQDSNRLSPNLSLTLARFITFFDTAQTSGMLRLFYLDRTYSETVILLAALRSYQKHHGAYPSRLETALQETSLPMVTDPATHRPAGFRLEAGGPCWWFAGVDGKDDSGRNTYGKDNVKTAMEGFDLIGRVGDYPQFNPEGKP